MTLFRGTSSFVIAVALLVFHGRAGALEPNDWRFRQTVAIERAGVAKLALPPATLDAARPGLEDLRLLDGSGHEVPFWVEHATSARSAGVHAPKSFRATLQDAATVLTIETGTTTPLERITLSTPAPSFLKPARVEVSGDGAAWSEIAAGVPLFRQFGAEQLSLDIGRRAAAFVRVTIDDSRSRPMPFTSALLHLAPQEQPAPTTPLSAARISRRDEFTGETVLTLDLGARNVPLAALRFVASDALFTRKISLLVHELHDETAYDRTLFVATIYRLSGDGIPPSEKLDVPLSVTAPSREISVHIDNGDSPPLAIDRVDVEVKPTWIVFSAPSAGTYTLLTGNPDAPSPRYDLAGFAAALKNLPPTAIPVGPLTGNAEYRKRDALADTPLLGGPIDPTGWRFHKAVKIAEPGVQQLELDVAAVSANESGFADLRLVRERTQIPYLLERPALTRTVLLDLEQANDPKHPQFSRWRLKLPSAHLPIVRLSLASPTPLFQREFRLYEVVSAPPGGEPRMQTLATLHWNKSPTDKRTLDTAIALQPTSDTLWLETDNGDNPAVALEAAHAAYPVVRLLFKVDPSAAPFELYYGNPAAAAPRYDIALIADQIMAAEKHVATLERTVPTAGSRSSFVATRAGVLFWAALGLVVIVLLVVVAKLLPKPPRT